MPLISTPFQETLTGSPAVYILIALAALIYFTASEFKNKSISAYKIFADHPWKLLAIALCSLFAVVTIAYLYADNVVKSPTPVTFVDGGVTIRGYSLLGRDSDHYYFSGKNHAIVTVKIDDVQALVINGDLPADADFSKK